MNEIDATPQRLNTAFRGMKVLDAIGFLAIILVIIGCPVTIALWAAIVSWSHGILTAVVMGILGAVVGLYIAFHILHLVRAIIDAVSNVFARREK